MSKSLEIRGTWKQRLVGKLAAWLIWLLGITLRYKVEDPHRIKGTVQEGDARVWVFWHSGLLVAPLALTRFLGPLSASTLTSASKDGAIIESFLAFYGVDSVRGSSSRRAVAALIALKRALKKGDQVFITPDGPRGPRYQMEGGVVKLAQSTQSSLHPVRFEYSSAWRLKTWDRLCIPKPFSRVTLFIEEAVNVPQKLNDDEFEMYRKKVETTLREGIDDFPEDNKNKQ